MKQFEQQARDIVGAAVPRIEDPPLVTGRGLFAGDVIFPRQLHMRVVRSPLAHGQIMSVDAADALTAPGVVAVWTDDDIADAPADRFPRRQVTQPVRIRQPALARRPRALCRRSGRGGVRRRSLRRRGRRRACDARDRGTAGGDVGRATTPGEFEPGRSTEAIVHREELRRSSTPRSATPTPSSSSTSRPAAIRRAAGDPRRDRRYDAAKDLLELHGAAKIPHRNRETLCRMLKRPPAVAPSCTRAMSAAASAFAASFIPRTCWSARGDAASAGRSNGSRTGAST